MKRTDQERIAREIGRQQKKEAIRARLIDSKEEVSVAGYAKALEDVFMWDDETVYNIQDDAVLEVLLEMKENLSDKDLEAALKRAIKKTGVKDRDTPLAEALELLEE
jgi:DNA-directed RNA polymerase specialized sigma subunit